MNPDGPQTVEISYDTVHKLSMDMLEKLNEEDAQVGEAIFALATTIVRLMKPTTVDTYDQDVEMETVNGIVEYLDALLSTDKKES